MEQNCNKLILAVIAGDDYSDTVKNLNQEGFYATILSSTGGFLRKKSITLMIGVDDHEVDKALAIIKKHAGERMETTFLTNPTETVISAVPLNIRVGGTIAFVLNVEKCVKY